jgi:predicted DsbA family dithiol-disulfide isomerase
MSGTLAIDVFSDVICPWCFIGKRRLERALDETGLALTAAIRWLPFELNPGMPPEGMERALYRARKFGSDRAAALDRDMTELGRQEGIGFAFDRMRRTPNTHAAHGLIVHAARSGRAAAAVEALFTAYFEQAIDIGDEPRLVEIGAEVGLDEAEVRAALRDEALHEVVAGHEQDAGRLGIAGVPFVIINNAWSVSGAQPVEIWRDMLRRAHATLAEVHEGGSLSNRRA